MERLSRWQDATDKRMKTLKEAKEHGAMLKKANPRRRFRVSLVTDRGRKYYVVSVKI